VAGLASALSSLVKRAVQFIRAAASMKGQPAGDNVASSYFPAIVYLIVNALLIKPGVSGAALAATSSSSRHQVHASAALLVVLFARSLVQLADAMEAAGPKLLFDSFIAEPDFCVRWQPTSGVDYALWLRLASPLDEQHNGNVEMLWQHSWQQYVVHATLRLWETITRMGLSAAAAAGEAEEGSRGRASAAAAPAVAEGGSTASSTAGSSRSSSSSHHVQQGFLPNLQKAGVIVRGMFTRLGLSAAATPAATAAVDDTGGHASSAAAAAIYANTACRPSDGEASSSSGGNPSSTAASISGASSSSSQQVQWRYLLDLLQADPVWAAAAAKFRAAKGALDQQRCVNLAYEDDCAELDTQRYAEGLEMCKALTAAAPLTVVCNNPSCENLAGVSEAAAASKLCVGCRCRYCCAACQAIDWRRHKRACRRMAAAGQSCA
jgi:hypothetical protein